MLQYQIKKHLFKLFLLGIAFPIYSQGGWDIKYISIQNLNSSFENKQIALDIRNKETDTLKSAVSGFYIRPLFPKNRKDSIVLSILDKKMIFQENWNIYTDMGFV